MARTSRKKKIPSRTRPPEQHAPPLPVLTAEELHHKAMDQADEGDAFKKLGKLSFARGSFSDAHMTEKEAWEKTPVTDKLSRAVLARSAAWLAVNGTWFKEAIDMAVRALAEDPPELLKDELIDVLVEAAKKYYGKLPPDA